MAARARLVLTLAAAPMSLGVVACLDLFHSTASLKTACELDAQACADAAGDGGPDAPADFCAWTGDLPRQRAAHACAWLGACESPLGRNAFGACMFQALLAYDCTASPGHAVAGATRDAWDCLWRAQSCADVDRCVFPDGPPVCGSAGEYTGCGGDVRIECVDGGAPRGEPCRLWGQGCASDGRSGACSGGASPGCQTPGCIGTALHWCADGGDQGIDCASTGAGQCVGLPTAASALWVACVPTGDAGCEPDASATCDQGYASACPAGVPETIHCEQLLQVPGASCTPGPLAAPFDWTSPCVVSPPACSADSCSGTTLTGCERGAPFVVDCATEGLGACQLLPTDVGSLTHAACGAP